MSDNVAVKQNDSRHELRELVSSQLQILLQQNNLEGAKALLIPVQHVDIAEAIEYLPPSMQLIAFRLLNKDKAIYVYEHLETSVQQVLIEDFKRQEVLDIVDKMSPDDRVRLFDELPSEVVSRILAELSPEQRQATNLLLGYEEDTAGRIMTPEYVAFRDNLTIPEVLTQLRTKAKVSELIYYIYVLDDFCHLVGVLSLRDLVINPKESVLGEIMTKDIVYVNTDLDQEEVARLIQRYDFLAIPVVDRELRLVGVVTVDDVIDIIQAEATEDIYALSGLSADGDNYFQMNIFAVAKKRVTWLFVLLITNSFTGTIIGAQEDILAQVTVLAAFIPLLIDSGGNIGTQSSTVVIRGISTDEVRDLGVMKVIYREGLAGLILGVILGIITMIWAYLLPQTDKNVNISFTVGVSLICISFLASIAGSALPFLFKRLGLDPALMSGPFITTAVDVLGVLIYFNVARIMLGF
jgi:magnesium transporter